MIRMRAVHRDGPPRLPSHSKHMKKADSPIRVGIVGLGRAGFGMQTQELLARPDTYEIVAGCDLSPRQRRRFKGKVPGAAVYARAEDLFADPRVELVSVATRTPTHVELAVAALRAGKLVMDEKPIATTLAGARRLVAEGKKHPGKLFFRHNRRFEAAFNDVRDVIASGLLGEIEEIRLCRHNYARRDDWQTIRAEGGGQLLNWGPHLVDHALQFLGGRPDFLHAELRRIAAVGDAEDHVHLLLRRGAGPLVEIEISGGAAMAAPVYFVIGSRGTLVSDDEKTLRLRYLDPKRKLPARRATTGLMDTFGRREELPWVEETREVRKDLRPDCIWDDLHEHLRRGRPFRVKTEEAFEVMRVLALASKAPVL